MSARKNLLIISAVFAILLLNLMTANALTATLTNSTSPAFVNGEVEENSQLIFYADYKDFSNGNPAIGNCTINFSKDYYNQLFNMTLSGNYYSYNTGTNLTGDAGTYYYLINCTSSTYDNLSYSGSFTVKASSGPSINIASPTSYSTHNSESISQLSLDFTANDTLSGIHSCWYYLSGAGPYQLNNCQNTTLLPISDGSYSLNLFANDTLGNANNQTVHDFLIDTTPPSTPTLWTLPTIVTTSTINIIGYIHEPLANVSITPYTPTYSQTTGTVSQISGGYGALNGSCFVMGGGNIGDTQLTLNCTDPSSTSTNKYFEVSGQTPQYFRRYDITSNGTLGEYRNITFSPSLDNTVSHGTVISVYDTEKYNGWFNITIILLQGTNNTIEIRAEDFYGNNRGPDIIYIKHNTTLNLNYSGFTSNLTSNFAALNISNLTNPYIGVQDKSQIRFIGSGINIDGYDLDKNINLSQNYVSLNSSALPNLDMPANITLYGINYTYTPKILLTNDSGTYPCPQDTCSILSYANNTLIFNVSHFSAYTSGANAQLFTTDDVSGVAEINTSVNFYANYTNTTSGQAISGATCIINFSDGINKTMTFNGQTYASSRNFSLEANYTYNVTCLANNYETLTVTDSIEITSLKIEKPTVWDIPTIVYDATLNLIGYVGRADVDVMMLVHDQAKANNSLTLQVSGATSTLIGEYTVEQDRGQGNTSIVLNGTDLSGIQNTYYIEFDHNTTYFVRYDILSVSTSGPNSRTITISPGLEYPILTGSRARIYNTQLPTGYFNVTVNLFPDIQNYIEIWGEKSGQKGEVTNLTLLYNTTRPVINFTGVVNDTGITSYSRNLNFTWNNHSDNATYEIAIGTAKYPNTGYDSIQSWLTLVNQTQYNATYNLAIDTVYYANVRVKNGSIVSNVLSSNGIIYIDLTPPTCAGQCVVDQGTWTNNPMISATWNFTEQESSIIYYEWEVGTGTCYTPNSSNVLSRTQMNITGSTVNILTPINNATYYFNVWAKNSETLRNSSSTCYSSDGIRFDNEQPVNGSISYPAGQYYSNNLIINFSQGTDAYSDVQRAELYQAIALINNASGLCSSFGSPTLVSDVTGTTGKSVTVENGKCYRFELQVYDNANNKATYVQGGMSYNFSVDSTPPASVQVYDSGFFTTLRNMYFNWTPSSDTDSGIKGYSYKLYEADENGTRIRDVTSWTYTQNTYAQLNNLRLNDSQYYFLEVFATNNFNLNSSVTTSDGLIFFDNSPPDVLNITSVNTDTTLPFLLIINDTEVNVTVYGEPGESCEVSRYDIGYIGWGEPLYDYVITEFTTNDLAYGNFTINQGNLSEGHNTFYIVCKDINGNAQTDSSNTQFNFTIDTSAPTITVNPANESIITGIVKFTISTTDYSGISKASYKVNNATNNSTIASGILPEGEHNISISFQSVSTTQDFNLIINATDNYNRNTVQTFLYHVDNTVPSISELVNNQYYTGNDDFNLTYELQMFTNYTINISLDGVQKLSVQNTSASQKLLENVTVEIDAYPNFATWPEGNYTIELYVANIFGKNLTNSSWFVIDRTAPTIENETITPSTVYRDNNVTLSIIAIETNIEQVILQHNANGSVANYTVSLSGDNYTYIIPALNLSTLQTVNYTWIAIDKAGNSVSTTEKTFTVENRNPYYTDPVALNVSLFMNNEDHYLVLFGIDPESDNITYGIKEASPNITASIIIYTNNDGTNATLLKISPDSAYTGSAWIILNISDSYGGYNESINYTFNINDSIGQTLNINSTDELQFTYYTNDSVTSEISYDSLDVVGSKYVNYEQTVKTSVPTSTNTTVFDIFINLGPNLNYAIILDNLNILEYPILNFSYQYYNNSDINTTLFLADNYTIIDSFIFKIDNNTYNGSYKVFWDFRDYNISENDKPFLKIFKAGINLSNLSDINYSTITMASDIMVNASSNLIWGTFQNFSLFVLAYEKPRTEVCGNSYDEDHDGTDSACPPPINPPSGGGSTGGSTSRSYSGGGGMLSLEETCTDKIKNQDETNIDCGGVCGGYYYFEMCNLVPEPTCTDKIKNQGESGMDCGGPCLASCPETEEPTQVFESCTDGLRNQDERGPDCGGVCGGYYYSSACYNTPQGTCNDGIKNQAEEDVDCGGSCKSCQVNVLEEYKTFIGFGIGGIIIIGLLLGFVLALRRPERHEYNLPNQNPAEAMPLTQPFAQESQSQTPVMFKEAITIEPQQVIDKSDLEKLALFINKEQAKGTSNSKIRVTLMHAEWPESLIDEAFERTECTSKLKDLDRYIKTAKNAGHSEDHIRQKLLEADWAEHFIDMVLHEVHVLHDDFEKVERYAKKMISKGYTKEDVLKTLMDVGWNKTDVEQYL